MTEQLNEQKISEENRSSTQDPEGQLRAYFEEVYVKDFQVKHAKQICSALKLSTQEPHPFYFKAWSKHMGVKSSRISRTSGSN